MPALSIDYTEAELNELNQLARQQGVPVTRLVHDAPFRDAARDAHRQRVAAALDKAAAMDAEILEHLADL